MKLTGYQFGLFIVLLCFSKVIVADISEEYRQGLKDLELIENKMTTIYLNIEKITAQLQQTKKKIVLSKTKIQELSGEKDRHLKVLKKQLQNIQKLKVEPKFKHFFNPKFYAEKIRVDSYYYELRRHHINTLSILKKNNRSLKQQQHQKSLELDELTKNQQKLKADQKKVKSHYASRQKKIQKMKKLLLYTENRGSIRFFLKEKFNDVINKSQTDQSGILPGASFGQLKGRMQWPSIGEFQYALSPYRAAWRVFHQEPEEVKAIADGVVTLITWIPQLGLVVIIDHGEGYQSIYGNNSIVIVNQGQKVKHQQVISKTGNTGGRDDVGLFFQLRYKKQPIDFRQWLRSS